MAISSIRTHLHPTHATPEPLLREIIEKFERLNCHNEPDSKKNTPQQERTSLLALDTFALSRVFSFLPSTLENRTVCSQFRGAFDLHIETILNDLQKDLTIRDLFPRFFNIPLMGVGVLQRYQAILTRTQTILDTLPQEIRATFPYTAEAILKNPPIFLDLLNTSMAISRITLSEALGGAALDTTKDLETQEEIAITKISSQEAKEKTLVGLFGKGICILPPEIGNLTALQSLYLNNNQLTSLPDAIGALTALKVLSLNGNQLTSLPNTICALTALKDLYLNNNKLTFLPDAIGKLSELYQLHLNNNQIQDLPKEIGNLTALQKLYLNQNQLTSLPDAIGKLWRLDQLALANNQIQDLPKEIGNLNFLQVLALTNNQLTSLPDAIGTLTALKELYLGGNQLTSLPGTIGALAALKRLGLGNNRA